MSQTEVNVCADKEATRLDLSLNESYKRLLASVSSDKLATRKVRIAELAWLRFRDAYIDAMYPAADKQAEYGTLYPMEVALLCVRLIQSHLMELDALMRQR